MSKVTEDKTTWGDGPWQNEPDRKEWRDVKTGLPCLAVRNMSDGHWCGYVGVPPGHPAHGLDEDDVAAKVHGGLTYAALCQGHVCHVPLPGEPHEVWWLGFDCSHSGDLSPATNARYPGYPGPSVYRRLPFVEQQCALLADQLARTTP